MTTDEPRNIHPYRREHLEPEIAAMSVEFLDDDDDGEKPTVIVNIDDPGAKGAIKKITVLIGAAFGGLAEWIRRNARDRPAVTALVGAGMSAAATAMLITITDNSDSRPPVVAERIVTVPAMPHTRTVTARSTTAPTPPPKETPRRSETAAQPSSWRTVAPVPEPTTQPTAQPERTRRPEPTPRASTPRPSTSHTPTSREATVQPTRDSGDTGPPAAPVTSAAPGRGATREPPEPEPLQSQPPPTQAAADCGGLIRVEVDPLLDLCLLG